MSYLRSMDDFVAGDVCLGVRDLEPNWGGSTGIDGSDARPAQRPALVAGWALDPVSGRPVCGWKTVQGPARRDAFR